MREEDNPIFTLSVDPFQYVQWGPFLLSTHTHMTTNSINNSFQILSSRDPPHSLIGALQIPLESYHPRVDTRGKATGSCQDACFSLLWF